MEDTTVRTDSWKSLSITKLDSKSRDWLLEVFHNPVFCWQDGFPLWAGSKLVILWSFPATFDLETRPITQRTVG
jgi:hypothetical protein